MFVFILYYFISVMVLVLVLLPFQGLFSERKRQNQYIQFYKDLGINVKYPKLTHEDYKRIKNITTHQGFNWCTWS